MTYGSNSSPQRLQYPQYPGGPSKYQITAHLEGGGAALTLPAATGAGLTGSGSVSVKDLKEKKLLEEKENGKDAATNGKVTT